MHRVRTSTVLLTTVLAAAAGATAATTPPTLEPAEVEATILERFPSVEAAAAALAAARARLGAARRLPDPTLELSTGRGEDRGGPGSGAEWGAALELELPTPWRYRAASGAARVGVALAARRLEATRSSVIATIRTLLVDLAAAQRRVAILEEQAATVRRTAEYTALRVRLGEARELERLRMQVELGRLERAVELARAERDGIAATLVRLSGDRIPAGFRLRMPLDRLPPPVDPDRLAARAAERSPDLAVERLRVAAARARARLVRALAMPSLVTRVERATEYDSRAAAVALAFRVPLWNANRPAAAAAEAEARAAEAAAERTRRDLLGRLAAVARRYEAARATAERFAREVIPAATESARIAEFAYREGETSILDLLDARRSAQDASLEALEVLRELHLLRVELDRISGALAAAPAPSAPEPDPEHADTETTP